MKVKKNLVNFLVLEQLEEGRKPIRKVRLAVGIFMGDFVHKNKYHEGKKEKQEKEN